MINTVFNNWNFVRALRLILGLLALGAAFSENDKMMGVLGILLTSQALFNVGCSGTSGCTTNYKATAIAKENEEVVYETIKHK